MDRRPHPIVLWTWSILCTLGISWLLVGHVALGQAEDEFQTFDADLGPAYIDVSAYPPEQRGLYPLFAQKCSKCHTLARPINSSMTGDEWFSYVNRMSRKPGSGISPKTAEEIFTFLSYDSNARARSANAVDPELLPFLEVSRELGGISRIAAGAKNVSADVEELRVRVEGDRRLDLKQLFADDDFQNVARWTQRDPSRAELQARTVGVLPGSAPAEESLAAAKLAAAYPPDAIGSAVSEAIGNETDPEEKVELLLDWLDESMTQAHRPGDNNAESALAEGQGDATEFTRVFCALAEAAGLHVRSRVGLVARRTSFHFHPWAEVWLDGWVPVDPYLGQLPADITHLRFVSKEDDGLTAWDPGRYAGLDRLRLAVLGQDDDEDDGSGGSQ